MVPTISTTCIQCGMEKGHSLLYCPPCTLVNNQKEQFEQLQRQKDNVYTGGPMPRPRAIPLDETLGTIIGLLLVPSLLVYWISDMGFWDSVVAVLWAPVAVFLFIFEILEILIVGLLS